MGRLLRSAQDDYPTGPVEFTFRLAGGDRAGPVRGARDRSGEGADRTHAPGLCARGRPGRCASRFKPAIRNRAIDGSDRSTSTQNRATSSSAFDEMTPVGSGPPFDPALADTLLFVVDTTNTLPGTEGSFTIENLRVER